MLNTFLAAGAVLLLCALVLGIIALVQRFEKEPAAQEPELGPDPSPAVRSVIEELGRLSELHDQGILTDAAYNEMRQAVLDEQINPSDDTHDDGNTVIDQDNAGMR